MERRATCSSSALAQPRVAVHRDFMPRNLMVADPNPGIRLGTRCGPDHLRPGVDAARRLISWDEEQELDWAVRYWQQARAAGLPVDADFWRVLAPARVDGGCSAT